MASQYLNKLSKDERKKLLQELHNQQEGNCFICGKSIDLQLHKDTIDVDHIEPLNAGGPDKPNNFAITHQSCNREKQDGNLRVARIIARFDQINEQCSNENRAANLGDVLAAHNGGSAAFPSVEEQDHIRFSLPAISSNDVIRLPIYQDKLSGFRYFFAQLPIQYIHHDSKMNPRAIGSNIKKLLKEFHKKRPQLHVALGWIQTNEDNPTIHIFDGQHKAAAQIMLGATELPVRVFVDPDLDILLTANTNAGTTLRQVAFDKSVQRNLGSVLLGDRMQRYRADCGLEEDNEEFSEKDLINHFKGESREMRKYILDWVRSSITHHRENKLREYIEYGGRSSDLPFSYSTIEKTFYSFFIGSSPLATRFNYKAEEGINPRQLEITQMIQLMNLIADELYIDRYDPGIGSGRLESKVIKGDDIPDDHLRAHRMAREEVIYNWLRYVKQIIQMSFVTRGQMFDESAPMQKALPESAWSNIQNFLISLRGLPIWVNHDMAKTVFGGKRNNDFWKNVFETGETPDGQGVLSEPLNMMDMIQTANDQGSVAS